MTGDLTYEALAALADKEYYSKISEIIITALYSQQKFYMSIINSMYEIFDKDEDTLNTILEKYNKYRKALNIQFPVADSLSQYFKDEYSYGDVLALDTCINACLSYKSGIMDKDDYLEIRDMFVPFNLPISIQVDSIEPLFELIKENKDKIVLLDKIGKIHEDAVITDENLKLALEEINFKDED